MHPKRPSPRLKVLQLLSALALIFVSISPSALEAAVCSRGPQPAATLLVPYFEVDIADPGGQTTLFSIGNAGTEPTLAHVIVWSDLGYPLIGFFVHIGPEGVETINLRDVIGKLQVPSLAAADAERFPGCTDLQQPIGGLSAEQLQLRLIGKPDPSNDRCFGRVRGDTSVAVGFVTVDVAADCVPELEHPADWVLDSLAADANVLWGDIFYVDPGQDSAQGLNAVAIRHDPGLPDGSLTFYPNDLDRVPTDETWRTRYISGSGVGADTEVIVWMGAWLALNRGGLPCDNAFHVFLFYAVRSGPQAGPLTPDPLYDHAGAVTRKLTLTELFSDSEEEIPENGVLEIEAWNICWPCIFLPPEPFRYHSIVRPTFRASNRFSLALEATPINGSCPEP